MSRLVAAVFVVVVAFLHKLLGLGSRPLCVAHSLLPTQSRSLLHVDTEFKFIFLVALLVVLIVGNWVYGVYKQYVIIIICNG